MKDESNVLRFPSVNHFSIDPGGQGGGGGGGGMDEILKRLTALEVDAARISTTVQHLATRADIESLKTSIETVRTSIEGVNTRIESKQLRLVLWIVGTGIALLATGFTAARLLTTLSS